MHQDSFNLVAEPLEIAHLSIIADLLYRILLNHKLKASQDLKPSYSISSHHNSISLHPIPVIVIYFWAPTTGQTAPLATSSSFGWACTLSSWCFSVAFVTGHISDLPSVGGWSGGRTVYLFISLVLTVPKSSPRPHLSRVEPKKPVNLPKQSQQPDKSPHPSSSPIPHQHFSSSEFPSCCITSWARNIDNKDVIPQHSPPQSSRLGIAARSNPHPFLNRGVSGGCGGGLSWRLW